MTNIPVSIAPAADVFASLEGICQGRGLDPLAGRLVDLRLFLEDDLAEVERAIASASHGDSLAQRSARHLLDQEGKRLRPICVALAARAGTGFNAAARAYAVSVELVHNATLLHDDVVDLGDRRRGADAARVVYGNAASIFGGDWLLVDALCRIQAANIPGVIERMLDVIKEMVVAESMQLAGRGRLRAGRSEYFQVVSGKTAALFRWAMYAGARAGGLDERATAALERYGDKLGIGFQLVDDLLDVAGDPGTTGKALLTDLREGKMTYPLILAMERDREIVPVLEQICASSEVALDPALGARVQKTLAATRVADDCLDLATRFCREAAKCLDDLPPSRARSALEAVALSTPKRSK
ncbi:MAG: polyprenyl synthetase family protein [Byssovorax sp.]